MIITTRYALTIFFALQAPPLFSQAPAIEWTKCLGGVNQEKAWDLELTADGGYILVGAADYDGGDVSGTIGGRDCWVVKVDNTGNLQWQKCLGGTNAEGDYWAVIEQTIDGGYVVATETLSND